MQQQRQSSVKTETKGVTFSSEPVVVVGGLTTHEQQRVMGALIRYFYFLYVKLLLCVPRTEIKTKLIRTLTRSC